MFKPIVKSLRISFGTHIGRFDQFEIAVDPDLLQLIEQNCAGSRYTGMLRVESFIVR